MPEWLPYYALLVPVTALAGVARGVAGFGGPFIMLPAMTLFHGPTTSVVVTLAINLLANVKLIPDAWPHVTRRVSVPLAVGTIPMLPLGTYALIVVDPEVAKRAILVVILANALVLLTGWRYRRPIGGAGYAAVGAVNGLILGATSIGVQVALFLYAGRDTAVQARANFIIWSFYGSAAVAIMAGLGADHPPADFVRALPLVPAYFAGLLAGMRLYRRISDTALRRFVIAMVVVMAGVGLVR